LKSTAKFEKTEHYLSEMCQEHCGSNLISHQVSSKDSQQIQFEGAGAGETVGS
jgi:hypothetical protein